MIHTYIHALQQVHTHVQTHTIIHHSTDIHTDIQTQTYQHLYVIYLLCSDDVVADLFILHCVVLGTGYCESYKYFLYGPLLLFNGGLSSKSILVSASWLAFQNFVQ